MRQYSNIGEKILDKNLPKFGNLGRIPARSVQAGGIRRQSLNMLKKWKLKEKKMILNLHLEQYLHKGMAANEFLLNDIMEQLNAGEIAAKANGKILKLNDRLEPNAKVILEKQFKEKEAVAA